MSDDYTPPEGSRVALTFGPDGYIPPEGNKVALEFSPSDDPGGIDQYLFPVGTNQLFVGYAEVKLRVRYVLPGGIASTLRFGSPSLHNYDTHARPIGFDASAFGTASLRNLNRYVTSAGFDSQVFGTASILNWNKTLYPGGFNAARYGGASIANTARILRPQGFNAFRGSSGTGVENWWRYLRLSGFSHTDYGRPSLFGGVKYVRPSGRSFLVFGSPRVINTTADQFLMPGGILAPGMGIPSLSPRILYPNGFLAGRPGNPLVQRNPNPLGWESSRTGSPEVDYKTKWVSPDGIAYGEWVGYPRVFDRAQYVLASSVIEAGVFGDTLIRNQSRFVRVPGSDFFLPSDWATVASNRRALLAAGWDAAGFGLTQIENATPSFTPTGFDSLVPGVPGIGYAVRYLYAPGFNRTAYGAGVVTKTPELQPPGFYRGGVGEATVWHRVRNLEVRGRDSQLFGVHTAWFRYRHLDSTGFAAARYGAPTFQHSLRTLLTQGANHEGYGRPSLSNANRTVAPSSIFENFAHSHMVGGTRYLLPRGYIATQFGTRIIPPIQNLYPLGFAGAFGVPWVENRTKQVQPNGITTGVQPADRWGAARAFNLVQFIEQTFDANGELTPPAWPQWTLIENRNKFLQADGREVTLFGYTNVANNARLISPAGMAPPQAPSHYEAGMVSHRIRNLPVEGMEPPYISGWGRIYNDAFVVAPESFQADAFGDAELKNTRRTFRWIGGFDSAEIGQPMIAFRIRELTFEHRYTIAPPYVRLPVVDLYTRYVEPQGDDALGMGLVSLMIRWNIITTRWAHQELFGWPAARNLTPEVQTRGRNSEEFGLSALRTQWRTVEAIGSEAARFGGAMVADRDRSFPVPSIYRGGYGRAIVIRTGAPPYSEQTISLRGRENEETGVVGNGDGIPPPPVGEPGFNQNVVYPSGRMVTSFGGAIVTSNVLMVRSGIAQYVYGRPHVQLQDRGIIGAGGISNPSIPSDGVLVTPFRVLNARVWSVFETIGRRGTQYGRPRVSTYLGVISRASVGALSSLGYPRLALSRRYIEVRGIQAYRFGWHSTGDGTIFVDPIGRASSVAIGRPTVEREPYLGPQTVSPRGIAPPPITTNHFVSLFHRELRMSGFNALHMGASQNGDPLYLPQRLRVHRPLPTIPVGNDMMVAGEPWVSYRVREVHVQGGDYFESGYDPEYFAERMRVRNNYMPVAPGQQASPVGIGDAAIGVPNVLRGTHYILPDGNADQYRKGAF